MYYLLFVTVNSPPGPWEWNISYIYVFLGISMYVCMYVCMYVYMQICMCVYLCINSKTNYCFNNASSHFHVLEDSLNG